MVSGFDKYFQIAPCFRDEDARADRSPGEFYQLDFEMSFATQEDVFRVGEEVLADTFNKFAPEGYEVTQTPFPIISYKEAMLKYGTDKPDLRNPLEIIDVTDFFQRCTFKPFHGKTVRAIKVEQKLSKGFHEKLLKFAQSIGMGGLGYLEVLEDGSYKGPIDKFIPAEMKDEIREMAGLKALDTIFFIADTEKTASIYAGQIRTALGERLDLIDQKSYKFCYINDFPMYEYDPEEKKMISHIIHSQCHRVVLRHWRQRILKIFLHTSMTLYVTVLNYHQVQLEITIWKSWLKLLKLQATQKMT